ncbi:MAG: HesA/MoeB/ThiF family protein [Chitinispirillaceae bacterium]
MPTDLILTDSQIERYSRHIVLKQIGLRGQSRLLKGKVLIVGLGALGSPAALYLAAAGVGCLGLADFDVVEHSNLQRQILYSTDDVGRSKVEIAGKRIRDLNSDVKVTMHEKRLCAANISEIVNDYNFVIDGTDSFPSKLLINDACVKYSIPFSHAGAVQFIGQTMTILPGVSACLRCIVSTTPQAGQTQTCSESGILGPVAGILGTIQAVEAIKYIAGAGTLLQDRVIFIDALSMDFRSIVVHRSLNCPVCSSDPEAIKLSDQETDICRR